MNKYFPISALMCVFLMFNLIACSESSDSESSPDGDAESGESIEGQIDGDAETEAESEQESLPEAICGDGVCSPEESALACALDCPAECGDGVCTAGEFCAVCPDDCDCETLSATPPMGWNSWNKFHCDINEALVRETADAMVTSGMKDAGYEFVNIDDCWQVDRDDNGVIVVDAERFPSGMKALADYVHSKGLKFGLYTCVGTLTCKEKPGSYNYEEIDAATYAEWGVDYVKVDWCYTEGMNARERYEIMHAALEKSGRPIVHSICNWGNQDPWIWGARNGQLWRTTGDIGDIIFSMILNYRLNNKYAAYAGKGHWNDPDMLEIGNGQMSDAEYRSHMALWAVASAPLLAGNDLRDMSDATLELLTNPEVIAVNQDPSALQGVLLAGDDVQGVWAKPLMQDGARAAVLFNGGEKEIRLQITSAALGLQPGTLTVRDLLNRSELGEFEDEFDAEIAPHESVMVRILGRESLPPSGESYLSDLPWKYAANSLGPVELDSSAGGEAAQDGQAISIGGTRFEKGLGTGASSIIIYHLGGNCTHFTASVGIDDEVGESGTAVFQVVADDEILFTSATLSGGDPAAPVDVEIEGRRELRLIVDAAYDSAEGDHADWADARINCR